MDCSNCGSPIASVYTREINGREQKVCLCKECYKRLYQKSDASKVFARIFGSDEKASDNDEKSRECPSCGATLESFRKTGLVGCADCYIEFRTEIFNSLRYCQWDAVHRGKEPTGATEERYDLVRDLAREQETVIEELNEAYAVEDDERAKRLEKRLKSIKAILSYSEGG